MIPQAHAESLRCSITDTRLGAEAPTFRHHLGKVRRFVKMKNLYVIFATGGPNLAILAIYSVVTKFLVDGACVFGSDG
jgi:hypothetical protein